MTNNNVEPSDLEYKQLEVHVDKCAMRYEGLQNKFEQVDQRLDTIEQKVELLKLTVESGNKGVIKTLVATAGTIVAGVLSTVVVILLN